MADNQASRVPAWRIEQPRLLAVEGRDEEGFFRALLEHLGLEHIQVLPIGGKTQIKRNLRLLTVAEGFEDVLAIGVVRDADDDVAVAFQSVTDALKRVGLPFPDEMLKIAVGSPSTVVAILPDCCNSGMLEDLCLGALADDGVMSCVDDFFACMREQGFCLPDNLSKAKMHCFLSSKEIPGKRLGEAALADYLPWNSPAFEQIVCFLRMIADKPKQDSSDPSKSSP